MRNAIFLRRDPIFRDFYTKLDAFVRGDSLTLAKQDDIS
jgi:hypothetical protein